jgi:HK97 family phage major capsid protein
VPYEKLVWIMHGRTWEVLDEQLVASEANNYALMRDLSLGTPLKLLGWPVFISNQIPTDLDKGTSTGVCSEVYLGKIDTLVLGRWGGITVEESTHAGFASHQMWIKAVWPVDVGVKQDVAWCLCADALDA